MEYLDRNSAPLNESEWSQIDQTVIQTAAHLLVGRKVLNLTGPLGSGVSELPYTVFNGQKQACVDLSGNNSENVVEATSRARAVFPMIYQDFKLNWREIESARKIGLPFDTASAAIAARFVAIQEDEIVFNGSNAFNTIGLLNTPNSLKVQLQKWEDAGAALADTVKAVETLSAAGHYGPYAMVLSSKLFGQTIRPIGQCGQLILDQMKNLMKGGIHFTNAIHGNKGVVIATGTHNAVLAIGTDINTSFLGPVNMNHLFRVFESVALLVRAPDSICVIE
ncbi:MAG: bacteriocin family protein [Candidatus Riflebacteria bacterium]|nr:bacteriocin family protein [Candidatus Riflebacteria bacterium]